MKNSAPAYVFLKVLVIEIYFKGTSIKISFMHYMKWTRVMLPVVFKEFGMFYIF